MSRCLPYPGGEERGMSDIRGFFSDGGIQRAHPKVTSGMLYLLPQCQVHSRTPSLAVIVMHPLSEHCPALSLFLEFPSTARKAPAPLSLVARAHIQQAQLGSPVGRHAQVGQLNIFPASSSSYFDSSPRSSSPARVPLPPRGLDVVLAVLGPACQLGVQATMTSGMVPDPKRHQLSLLQPAGTRWNGVFLVCVFWPPQTSGTHPSCALLSKPLPQQGQAAVTALLAWGQAVGRRTG